MVIYSCLEPVYEIREFHKNRCIESCIKGNINSERMSVCKELWEDRKCCRYVTVNECRRCYFGTWVKGRVDNVAECTKQNTNSWSGSGNH